MGRKRSKPKRPSNTKKVWRVKEPSTSAAPPPPPPWVDLPRDVTANILQRLSFFDILESAQYVCTTWYSVCQDPDMWRVIDIRNDDYYSETYNLKAMCCHAVDRSQGQLIDITLEYFGDDELIDYICERSSHLKRLFLACCNDMTSQGLSEAVKKTPQLEELHINLMPSVFARDIEIIGTYCPMLKSFTFSQRMTIFPYSDQSDGDEDLSMSRQDRNTFALAVAKSMPNLHHLSFYGNYMRNVGLKAILDNCPHLESLDIRGCYEVDLGGDLGKGLSERIKTLRLPSSSTDDYPWDSCESYENDYITYEDSDYYDDYTNPFRSEYLSDNDAWLISSPDAWFFDHDHF